MKKNKVIIFILLILFFLIILFNGIFGTSLSYLSSKEIKEKRKSKEDLVEHLKIDNSILAYDKYNNTHYYMVSDKQENKNIVLKLELSKEFKYKLIGETLNIIKVNYNKPIKIIIYNDKYYYETKIQLTNLPIINIKSKDKITTNDTLSEFNYINVNNIEHQITNNSKIHIRGVTSQNFDKKSYKINMYNKSYTDEKEIRISNFYYGNSFVLDAVYRDPSKIRNVLATELWNKISNDFSNVNIKSEFVELFVNNEYKGLYVFTEPINRRRLNLNKSNLYDTSLIVKSQEWNTPNIKNNFSNIKEDSYMNYELKYPNDETLYSTSWEKILNKMSVYYDMASNSSYEVIKSTWNLENYIDMIIFNSFTNNIDNKMIKNNYFYMKSLNDNVIYIQPWDMEYTFGITYKSNASMKVSKDMDDYNKVYTDFEHRSDVINELLIDRYWKLRKNVLTKEYFDNLLDSYKNQLNKGAALRDSSTWYEYDVETEIEEIRTWIYNRLEFFDEYIKDLENG